VSVPVVLAAVVLIGAAVRLRRAARRRRLRERSRIAELELLRALSAELGAGAAPLVAWRTVVDDLGATDADGLVDTALPAAAGCDADDRAAALLRASASDAVRRIGSAWQVSTWTGAPLAVSLDRLAGAATQAAATARTVRATLAGPRMTARLLALLPVVGLGLAALSGADPLAILLGTPPGRLCLVVGVLLDVAGLLWIERLADAADP
jgi:tight adherence protein B